MEGLNRSDEQWRALRDFEITSYPGSRNALRTRDVLRSFVVDKSARYQPRDGKTFCNIFSWDFTRAMHCEIPHWWLADKSDKPRELTANDTLKLLRLGAFRGWQQISSEAVYERAATGEPVLAWWLNGYGPGHVAVVEPVQERDPWGKLLVAQAGRTCAYDLPMSEAFGEARLSLVEFYAHT